MTKLHMLGTGRAMATRCYNTCFTLRNGQEHFLVDGGGGNGILVQLENTGISLRDIRGVFVTHAHTDHILGVVWVLRAIAAEMLRGVFEGELPVYCHADLARALRTICELTLPSSYLRLFDSRIILLPVQDGETREAVGLHLTFFDCHAAMSLQYGFSARLPDGQRLVCLGDEPYREKLLSYVENCDWLLAEAFCLYADRARYKPHEKGHSTAREAAALAEALGVKNLLLYHTEDDRLAERKALYSQEAAEQFRGRIFVPNDLETIEL